MAMSETSAPTVNTTPTDSLVGEVLDRRNESRRHMQLNYWDEWEDVYRSSKCLAKKILTTDKAGNTVEDTSRTNVCMPETSLTIRRNTARLTANPPQINYTSPSGNEDISLKLTAWAYQQFDRSGEAQQHRKMVQTGETFGWSVSKLWWDTVEVQRVYQRRFIKRDGSAGYRDRAGVMKLMGAPQDEIDGAVKELGPNLDDNEVSEAIAQLGDVVQVPEIVKSYEGPFSKNLFPGDVFTEPGAAIMDESGWVIENYWESELWLKKMAKKMYIDPETQEERPVFDQKSVAELYEMGSWNPNMGTQQPYDLRTRFRTSVLNQQVPLFPVKLLPGKRFDILEQHSRDENGTVWISWFGNEKIFLGKMPYPWNLYGKYVYTEFVPLFDLISLIGDSTPRLHRFLQALHNATVGARKDLVGDLLRPLVLQQAGEDGPDEVIERKRFRVLQVRNLNTFKPFIEPAHVLGGIQAANEEEAQIMRMWGLSEPSINNTESGTDSNPQAGRTATTAVLAAKSADALTQFKLDSLHFYLKESGYKKLWMLQQNESSDPYKIGERYAKKVSGLAQRYTGKVSEISIDPDEIQEDLEVEPEAMSMLSVDDDIRRTSAMQLAQMAAQSPGIYDPYYVARFAASTVRGVDPDKAVPQPQPPSPPPPKVTVNVAVKWPELPADVQKQIIAGGGIQITPETEQELTEQGTAKDLERVSQMSDHADNIMSPSSMNQHLASQEPETNLSRMVSA